MSSRSALVCVPIRYGRPWQHARRPRDADRRIAGNVLWHSTAEAARRGDRGAQHPARRAQINAGYGDIVSADIGETEFDFIDTPDFRLYRSGLKGVREVTSSYFGAPQSESVPVIAAGIANAALFHRARVASQTRQKLGACVSLTLWSAALFLGRWIALA